MGSTQRMAVSTVWLTNGLRALALAGLAAAALVAAKPGPAAALPVAKQQYHAAEPAVPTYRRAAPRRVVPTRVVPPNTAPSRAIQPRVAAPQAAAPRAAAPRAAIAPQYQRQTVSYSGGEAPGTSIIDTGARHLYLVRPGGEAIRYGVGVGRDGFGWSGSAKVGRKAEWPRWTPPSQMIQRQPELARWAGGMPGGVDNPLGARALYLYRGGRDTLYRIHGTNEPWSIGRAMSSGCIRMLNEDVVHLYGLARVGAKVVVR